MSKHLKAGLQVITFITAFILAVFCCAGILLGTIHFAIVFFFTSMVLFANFYERKNNG